MNTNELQINPAHRLAVHEAEMDEIRGEVHNNINAYASEPIPGEQERAAAIGHELRNKAFDEVVYTQAEIDRARTVARVSQVIDLIFYAIYSLIGLQILLDLMGARRGNGFRNLIDTLSAPFLAPFESLLQNIGMGRYQLKLSYVFAFIVYLILHAGINAVLRTLAQRKTAI